MKTFTFDARLDGVSTSTNHWSGTEQTCSILALSPEASLSMKLKLRLMPFIDPAQWDQPIKITIEIQEPTIKMVPWKPEEMPMPCLIRPKEQTVIRCNITGIDQHGAWCCDAVFAFTTLCRSYEHSIDGGKTWLPAGRVETTYE